MQHIPKTKQPIDESQLQPEYFLQNIFSFFFFFCISFKQLNAHSAIFLLIRAHALIILNRAHALIFLSRKDKAFFFKTTPYLCENRHSWQKIISFLATKLKKVGKTLSNGYNYALPSQ